MHPEVRRLVDRAIDLTLGAGKVVMYPAATGAEARAMSQRGVRLITMNFGPLARRAIAEYLAAFRERRSAGRPATGRRVVRRGLRPRASAINAGRPRPRGRSTNFPEAPNGVRDPRPVHSVPGRGGCPWPLPGSPHLLRRPQLRRARARDGPRSGPRAAVLLHEARRRHRRGRPGLRLSVRQRRRPPRAGAGRRAGVRAARRSPPARALDARVRLRRRARHDAAGPAGRGEEDGPPVGHRQGVRRVGAVQLDPPRGGDRPPDCGRRRAGGERRRAAAGRPRPADLEDPRDDRLSLDTLHPGARGPDLHRHPVGRRIRSRGGTS